MMRIVDSSQALKLHDNCHYEVDTTKLEHGTAVTCPFDKGMKIGLDENGHVAIAKKCWFKPFN